MYCEQNQGFYIWVLSIWCRLYILSLGFLRMNKNCIYWFFRWQLNCFNKLTSVKFIIRVPGLVIFFCSELPFTAELDFPLSWSVLLFFQFLFFFFFGLDHVSISILLRGLSFNQKIEKKYYFLFISAKWEKR